MNPTDSPPPAKVGFVGLGRMGSGMAHRLRGAGHSLIVFNRDRTKTAPFANSGATVADRPIELARQCTSGIVFLCVADGPAVRAVLFGRGGLARGLSNGAVVVNTSTIGCEEARAFAERLAERGVAYVDAPVGGSADAAAEGRLLFYVGASPQDLERIRPLLVPLAREIVRVGGVGSGSAAKLGNNLVTIGTIGLLAEALAVTEGAGIERATMIDILLKGGARSSMLENKKEFLAGRTYPAKFSLALARKDLKLVERMAKDLGQPLVVTPAARRLFDRGIADGLGPADVSAVAETVARAREGAPAAGSRTARIPTTLSVNSAPASN